MLAGILLGLAAASLQSLSYIASGAFVRTYHSASLALLTRGYVIMGLLAALALPLAWPSGPVPAFGEYAIPMVLCTVFCLFGQAGLFLALQTTEASRVSPLLSLKILMLAGLSLALGLERYTSVQWIGIALSLGAAFLLGKAGKAVPVRGYLWLLFTCASYAASDYFIRVQFPLFTPHMPFVRASVVITLLSYVVGGLFGLLALPFAGRFPRRVWTHYALPFALAWLGAMMFLFACFGLIGVVHGNIVQSTRGLISIGIGYAVARAGHAHIEVRVDRATMFRRALAGALMLLAVVLFSLGAARKESGGGLSETSGHATIPAT